MTRRDGVGVVVLLVYLLGVGLLTGPSLCQLFLWEFPEPRLEWIPFTDIWNVVANPEAPGLGILANIVGNAVLLFPFGFLLPLFWRSFIRVKHTILCGFLLSLSIEVIQLIAGGVTSVDDLMLNTIGVAFGYAAARVLMQLCPQFMPLERKQRAQWIYPLGCWVAVIAFYTLMDLKFLG